jgi:hypothetical protein
MVVLDSPEGVGVLLCPVVKGRGFVPVTCSTIGVTVATRPAFTAAQNARASSTRSSGMPPLRMFTRATSGEMSTKRSGLPIARAIACTCSPMVSAAGPVIS